MFRLRTLCPVRRPLPPASEPAEKIDLPGGCDPQIEITLISLEGRKRTGEPADRAFQRLPERGRLTIESPVRLETRAGFFRRRASLLHASERSRDIQVLTDCASHYPDKFRVIHSDPPCV